MRVLPTLTARRLTSGIDGVGGGAGSSEDKQSGRRSGSRGGLQPGRLLGAACNRAQASGAVGQADAGRGLKTTAGRARRRSSRRRPRGLRVHPSDPFYWAAMIPAARAGSGLGSRGWCGSQRVAAVFARAQGRGWRLVRSTWRRKRVPRPVPRWLFRPGRDVGDESAVVALRRPARAQLAETAAQLGDPELRHQRRNG